MPVVAVFTAEIGPVLQLMGSQVSDGVVALNAEIREFFAGKVEFHVPVPADRSNLVRGEKCFSTNPNTRGQVWAQCSVAVSFELSDVDQARELAESFTSSLFPQLLIDVLDPALLPQLLDPSQPFVPASVQRQIDEQLAEYGSAEERIARQAAGDKPPA